MSKMEKSLDEWKRELDPETFAITRMGETETPFSGKYVDYYENGIYRCSNCKLELFNSQTKFDSGSGWPSFYDSIKRGTQDNVIYRFDKSQGMERTEVLCKRCGAHLGHVFEDGPEEKTGKRYCVNSVSLDFKKNG